MTQREQVLEQISEWLAWARDEGLREAVLAPEQADWLRAARRGGAAGGRRAQSGAGTDKGGGMTGRQSSGDRKPAARVAPKRAAPSPPVAPDRPTVPPPAPTVAIPADDSLERIATEIAACTRCPLHAGRTRTVPGQGNPHPEILFVGEAPGADEDRQGLAFVGRAGQLLTKMIAAMGFEREEVFIANINKCRPPDNRAPTTDEMAACLPFLKRQIAILQPKVIVAMGSTAINGLVEVPKGVGITKLRGTWMTFEGIDLMPTFHPSYLLRNPPAKKPVWEDLKAVLHRLGRPVPPVKRGGGGGA